MSVSVQVEEVGTYLRTKNRKAVPNGLPPRLNEDSRLYGPLNSEMDLTLGTQNFRGRHRPDKMVSLFDYIRKTSRQGSSLKQSLDADFVSNRSILISIASSKFKTEPMKIQAVRQKGVVFLVEKKANRTFLQSPYGHKFEQYMTLNKKGNPHDKYQKLETSECTKAVIRTTLTSGETSIKLFYAPEVDAIDKDGNLIEIKTTGMDFKKWLCSFSLHHYLQAFLGNSPYIVFGRKPKTDKQVVEKVDTVWTSSIPNYEVKWNKDVCFETLFSVLQEISSRLENDGNAILVVVKSKTVSYEPEFIKNCTFLDSSFFDYFE